MKNYSLFQIVIAAQKNSSYFAEKFKGIKPFDFKNEHELLKALPITDHTQYWEAHQNQGNLMTENPPHGILYKSGGSTGKPKYSYFTSEEWIAFTSYFGWGMGQNHFADGDKAANLFYSGDLYASFLFIKDSLDHCPKKVLQFPLSGSCSSESLANNILEFQINCLVGVPTSFLNHFEWMKKYSPQALKPLKKLFYGGESIYPDQIQWIQKLIPYVQIYSVGYASVDAGLLGYFSKDCKTDEHRVFENATLMEIIDEETDEVITDVGRPGKLLITNLTRKLMPILRYPVGDRAEWVEPPGTPYRKFKLLGRSEEAARVGTVSVYFEDLREILKKIYGTQNQLQFQMRLEHHDHKDQLTLVLSKVTPILQNQFAEQIEKALQQQKPAFMDATKKGQLHPLKLEWKEIYEFEQNTRTGKIKRIIDRRK